LPDRLALRSSLEPGVRPIFSPDLVVQVKALRNDNYNSLSGDSYFSPLFWVFIGPVFLAFSWVGFLLSLAPVFSA
jgi:hypothetical protein